MVEKPYPVDRDIHLEGRGITLVPSYFCWGMPITLADDVHARLQMSPGTASHHTGVLRDAGVIVTTRVARTATHALTPLGEALLADTTAGVAT